MSAHSSPQQQSTSTWSTTSNQAKSNPAQRATGFAPQSTSFQTKPFVTAGKPAIPAAALELQARLDEKPSSKLPDLAQINLFAGAASSAPLPPPVQPKSEPDDVETDEPEAEVKIQRKCAECGATTGEDDDPDKPIQPKLTIGQPGDKYEQEADQMAAKVVSMPEPVVQRSSLDSFQKINKIQRKSGTKPPSTDFEQWLQSSKGSGAGLSEDVRGFMEPRFGADFSQVRVHTGSTAVQLNQEVGAQAFAHGNDIYFNAGKYSPGSTAGKELLAHELTHTIQQTGGQQIRKAPSLKHSSSASPVQAKTISNNIVPLNFKALQTKETEEEPLQAKQIQNETSEYFTNKQHLPAATQSTLHPKSVTELEADNHTNKTVSFKSNSELTEQPANTLQAKSVGTLPEYSISRTSNTVDGKLVQNKLAISTSAPVSIQRSVGSWILSKVGGLASKMPGFTLLCTILGKNPVTGEAVERSATSLIGGILKLIGQDALFQQLKESNAIENAFTWFNQQIAKLNLTWSVISGLFKQAWDSLSRWDLLSPVKAFNRIANIFSGPIRRIRNFASSVITKVGEFIFQGAMKLAGGAGQRVLGIIKKAGGAFANIIKNPIGFVGNLIQAVKGGFQKFAANIGTHLKSGLMGWLFGALAGAGLALPQTFNLKGIIDIVLQIIGATYENLRGMLVEKIGEERVARLERAFDFLKTLVTDGLAGAWEKIMEFAGNLQEMVIGGIKNWVMGSVVGAAITKLISMFNPAGAIVQAIISIYNTIMFFVERAQQIAALANSVFSSIGKIAAGNVGAAIEFVEQAMARTLPVIISFLARQVGLGDVAGHIKAIIGKVRGVIQGAIGKVANFIVSRAKGLFGRGQVGAKDQDKQKKVEVGLKAIDVEEEKYIKDGKILRENAQRVAQKVKKEHAIFKSISVIEGSETWDYKYIARAIKKGEKRAGTPKQGDHVFNKDVKKTIQELPQIPSEILGEDSKQGQKLASLLSRLSSEIDESAFNITVRKEGDRQAGGDENSRVYGNSKQLFMEAFRRHLIHIKFQSEAETEEEKDRAERFLEKSRQQLRYILLHRWLDAAVDEEALSLSKKSDIAKGKQQIEKIRKFLAKYIP